jgi:endonuclease/exonuclease/phosphatase (EEP) superfamily protein YafD
VADESDPELMGASDSHGHQAAGAAPDVSDEAAERRARWIRTQRRSGGVRQRIWSAVRHFLATGAPLALIGFWLVSVLIALTIRDRGPALLSYWYYATPPTVLFLIAAPSLVWLLLWRRWGLALIPVVLTLVSGVWAYRSTWYDNPAAPVADGSRRVLLWNVQWGQRGWNRVIAEIRHRDPDIVGLMEARSYQRSKDHASADVYRAVLKESASVAENLFASALPEYSVAVTPSGVALLVKGSWRVARKGILGGDNQTAYGHYIVCEIPIDDDVLHLVVVDISSRLGRPRNKPLAKLNELLKTLEDKPVLLGGDFNTPMRSDLLGALRRRFLNAFAFTGTGYAATWPLPFPVLWIDHAWFNEHVRVSRCTLGWTNASDHRPIELEISIAGEG